MDNVDVDTFDVKKTSSLQQSQLHQNIQSKYGVKLLI